MRNRSSRFTPGLASICNWSNSVTKAGVSVEIVSLTLMEVLRSGGLSVVCCGYSGSGLIRAQHAQIAIHVPAGLGQDFRSRGKHDMKRIWIIGSGKGAAAFRHNQSQILEHSIHVGLLWNLQIDLLRAEAEPGSAAMNAPGQK